MNKPRCSWCNLKNPLYVHYHDHEWGVPVHDDASLFEFLILESFQAGLSWECILNKREYFHRAFDSFDPRMIKNYDAARIEALTQDASIIRNRRKIEAAVTNARIFLDIQAEWGRFDAYIRHFTGGETIFECDQTRSPLSDAISADLKKRGMKFAGSTIIYAYLQAIGVIYSHDRDCFLFREA